MAWKETSPGRFSRPLGENEIFIKLVSDPGHPLGREHWAINSTATIAPQGELTPSRFVSQLRHAWEHLRFHHPSLAAYVAEDNKNLLYDVPSPEEVTKWVTKTFMVAQQESSSAEVIAKLKPSSDATLIYIPKSNELLGHTAHWRTDGIGVTLLLDGLLQLAVEFNLANSASLPWGEEPKRLAPAIEDAANIPLTPSEKQSALGKHYLSTFGLAAGAVGIPHIGEVSTLPQGTYSATRTIDAEITNSIVEKCKAQGLSVTSAVHASVAAANWKLATEERKNEHYTSTVRFSLRPYLPSPYSGPGYAAGLYTTGWMEKVNANGTWLDHAKHYNDIYHKGLSRDYIDAHREYAIALGDMLRNLPPDLPVQSDVDISSIGVAEMLIKRSYGSGDLAIDVVAVSVGVEILTRQAVCFVWTFRDQLNFSVVYNEAYHEKEQMQEFVKTVETSLKTGLSILRD
jgi:hypothetical protein